MKIPPFTLDAELLRLCGEIERLLGQISGFSMPMPQPKLRRQNRIRTIKDTLAIEGNSLSLEQVTAILDGRRVLGPKNEIIEVKNAVELYAALGAFDPFAERDFLRAHSVLMRGLVLSAGRYRSGNVGELKGTKVSHVAPPARLIASLMKDLFRYLRREKRLHPLIKSAIAHYEIEFIHPFEDGNGRMGRFWQTLILGRHHPVFEYLPTESVIREQQPEYYRELEKSDKMGSLNPFIFFSLNAVLRSLNEFAQDLRIEPDTADKRLDFAHGHFKTKIFSRRDYLQLFKTLSTATASRDLAHGVQQNVLRKKGDRNQTSYSFSASGKRKS